MLQHVSEPHSLFMHVCCVCQMVTGLFRPPMKVSSPSQQSCWLPAEDFGMSTCSPSSPLLNSKAPLSQLLQETMHVPDLFPSLHGEDARSWSGIREAEKGNA